MAAIEICCRTYEVPWDTLKIHTFLNHKLQYFELLSDKLNFILNYISLSGYSEAHKPHNQENNKS